MAKLIQKNGRGSDSWDGVADWYAGWSGAKGSFYHRKVVIPAVMKMLECSPGESIIDLGCGPGALARAVLARGGLYTGVDLSRKLLSFARKHQPVNPECFHLGNVVSPDFVPVMGAAQFDAAVFLLSLQDVDPLTAAIANAANLLKPGGRLVLLMTHPCFRIPRQSGWSWDVGRRQQFRRIDTYLSELKIPMQSHQKKGGITRSYHRPLETYVSALASNGLWIDQLIELPVSEKPGEQRLSSAEKRAMEEIPLFLGIRAIKAVRSIARK